MLWYVIWKHRIVVQRATVSPCSQNLFLLLIPSASFSHLASESSQLSAGSYAQTKPKPPWKELERFLTCTRASSLKNIATVSNARGQRSRCSPRHSQNGELRDLNFQALHSNLLFDTDILWPTVHMTTHSDGDGTLISRGWSFHVISPSFFPVGSVDLFAGQRIRVKTN